MTGLAGRGGWEVAYGVCNKCGKFAGSLFSDGATIEWRGLGAGCEHAPHERPPLDDPRVRRALSQTRKDGRPPSLRIQPADALS